MPLDLLYVRSLFRPADFGGNRYPWEVTRGLAARGHRVRVVTPRPSGALPGPTAAEMRWYPVSRRTPLETFFTNAVWSHVTVEREVARSRPDLIVLSSYETAWGHYALPGRSRHVLSVYIYHSRFVSDAVDRLRARRGAFGLIGRSLAAFSHHVERISLMSPQLLIAVSPYSRDEIRQRTGRADGVRIIPTGVDVEFFHAGDRTQARAVLGLGVDERVLVTVGRLAPVKRYDLAIDAFAILRRSDPRYQLLIIGDGPERARLETHARVSGAGGGIRFEGFRDGEDLRLRLWAADAEICTSEFENWSLAALEALAAGLPVLAVARGGLVPMLSPIEPRWLTDDDSPQGIARHVRECLANADLRVSGQAAARSVSERYGWGSVVTRLEEALIEVAQGRTSASAAK